VKGILFLIAHDVAPIAPGLITNGALRLGNSLPAVGAAARFIPHLRSGDQRDGRFVEPIAPGKQTRTNFC
jgi:hypothetical protein